MTTERKRKTSETEFISSRMKVSPLTSALAKGPVPLPTVTAPSLDKLEVKVPRPADPGEKALLERFYELQREHAVKRDRKDGEALVMGDQVMVNTLGYVGGKLIPFSARFAMSMPLLPQVQLPGFAEAIALGKVGESLQLQIDLPADYPVESMRGKRARFIVDILAAREVLLPDAESPSFLKKLNLGKNLDEVMANLGEQLADELADELILQGQEMVFDELVKRANPVVPRELVDEEVKRRWGQVEGKHLVEKGFDVKEQQGAMESWLSDPATRADCERRLQISLVLRAIAEKDKLNLTPEKLEQLVETAGAGWGLTRKDVTEGLRESPDLTEQVMHIGWHLLAVEHVMNKAKLTFEGA